MALQQINVTNRVATHLKKGGFVVCGNTDYVVEFLFDSEWDGHEEKTARFIWNDKYQDVKFTGNTCPMPAVHRADHVSVGVYAGELCTTTPAVIPCQRSILCGSDTPHEENEAPWASVAQEAAKAAQEAKLAAEGSAEEARQAAENAKQTAEATTAAGLKGVAQGELLVLGDVSPFGGDIAVEVSGTDDLSAVEVKAGGKNIVNIPNIERVNGHTTITVPCHITAPFTISGVNDGAVVQDSTGAARSVWRIQVVYQSGALVTMTDDEFANAKYFQLTSVSNPAVGIQYRDTYLVSGRYKDIQVEYGNTATAYEPYKDPTAYAVDGEGKATIKPIFPVTVLTVTEGATMKAEYGRDINKAFEELYAILKAQGVM